MKLPTYPKEINIARDPFGARIMIHANPLPGTYDFSTDGRVLLTPVLARRIANNLFEFAAAREEAGRG